MALLGALQRGDSPSSVLPERPKESLTHQRERMAEAEAKRIRKRKRNASPTTSAGGANKEGV